MVQIHIGKSRRLIPRAIAKVFVDSRDVALFITRHACGRMQQARGHNKVIEQPHIAPCAIFDVALVAVVSALERKLDLLANGARPPFTKRSWKLLLPQFLRFHDVIVDRNHVWQIVLGRSELGFGSGGLRRGHGVPPAGPWGRDADPQILLC
ncbi:unannotated protein [freshwater metagenome]|uniref:Unannotated protein n=1 Tax=freshwater metagenome TaxID=449393 RepID=A0A6J7VNL3_9ZZZZ